MIEIWKDIIDYEGLYQISNLGRVKSLKRFSVIKDRIMKPQLHRTGYKMVGLRKRGKGIKFFRVHRLVAREFVLNPISEPKKLFVNHIDGNKLNNNYKNLEWCTLQENLAHAFRNGLIDNKGEKMGWSKLKEWQVKEIKKKYIPRKYSMRKLAKEYGVSYTAINLIINNKNWKHI